MKKFRIAPALVAAALLMTALPGAPARADGPTPAPFSDTAGHWAEQEIKVASVLGGWVNGYPDGSFRPEGKVTRAEFLKMLAVLKGTGPVPIANERLDRLYAHLADWNHWAASSGYTKGALALGLLEPTDYALTFTPAGELDTWRLEPDRSLTRTDAAVLLTRALGRRYEAEQPFYHPGSRFAWAKPMPTLTAADGPTTPDWAKGWWFQAIDSGLIRGYPDNTLRGANTITRAEAVVMLGRLAQMQPKAPDLLAQLHAPETPAVRRMDGLEMLQFTGRVTMRWKAAESMTWEETAKAWASLSRQEREQAVMYAMKDARAITLGANYWPLETTYTMLSIEGKPNQNLAEGHYEEDEGRFIYLDVNGMADPANPVSMPIEFTVAADTEAMEAQVRRARERAAAQLAQPLEPRQVYTFPYQYLADFFGIDGYRVRTYAEEKARAFYAEAKARVEAAGGKVKAVRIQIAPSDTADRAGQYRSLKIAETLLESPVYELTFDGQGATVTRAPASLQDWVNSLDLQYEWVHMGEGWGAPNEDPPADAARKVMETFVITLGAGPKAQ